MGEIPRRAALIDEEPSQADQRAGGVLRVVGGALWTCIGRVHELKRGCGFVVAGRLGAQSFVDAHEALASAPDSHRDMFLEIPDFRVDISSTELRARARAKS